MRYIVDLPEYLGEWIQKRAIRDDISPEQFIRDVLEWVERDSHFQGSDFS